MATAALLRAVGLHPVARTRPYTLHSRGGAPPAAPSAAAAAHRGGGGGSCARRPLCRLRLAATQEASREPSGGAAPLVAVEGDIVTLNWRCLNEEGELLESSEAAEDPTTFEVGAGDIVGNRLFEAFDEAVRGMAVGDFTRVRAEGGEWKEELMFRVPRDHPEVLRLEGRYKNQGGLQQGMLVELSNGGMALVVRAPGDESGGGELVLDANNMLAGKALYFELELAALDRPPPRQR